MEHAGKEFLAMGGEAEVVTRVRWMIQRDLHEVLEIEKFSFEYPWDEKDFKDILRLRSVIGMVAENEDAILGFLIYELMPRGLAIVNMAVDPQAKRQGIGTAMLDAVKNKLKRSPRRTKIQLAVRENNLGAQLFLASNGFLATSVMRDFYEEGNEDAYVMEFTSMQAISKNRVAHLF